MSERAKIGLDNPVFYGRLRTSQPVAPGSRNVVRPARPQVPRAVYEQRGPSPLYVRSPATAPLVAPAQVAVAATPAQSTQPERENTAAARRSPPLRTKGPRLNPQIALFGMAAVVFFVGLSVSLQGMLTNHKAAVTVSALAKSSADPNGDTTTTNSGGMPSTVKPSANAFQNYMVAPDLPRYLRIPRLGVYSRVLQVGILNSGALGTPSNVYDTAWYTGSAKPGETGATLIDGHVSSWTTHGVFYGIKNLKAGDYLQIVRGDGNTLTYKVVTTKLYDADHVDMKAAVTAVTPGKSGLNLITCSGKVKPGTSEFTDRVVVFAELL